MALRAATRLGSCSHLGMHTLPRMAQRRFVHYQGPVLVGWETCWLHSNLKNTLNHPLLSRKNAFNSIDTAIKLDRLIHDREYPEGSPLHDVLFLRMQSGVKVPAIHALVKNGVNVNQINHLGQTPLDYALYFSSNDEERQEIVDALKMHWGVESSASAVGARAATKVLAILRTGIHLWASGPLPYPQ